MLSLFSGDCRTSVIEGAAPKHQWCRRIFLFWGKQPVLEPKPLLIWAWVYSVCSHPPHLLQPAAVGSRCLSAHLPSIAVHHAPPLRSRLPAPARLPTREERARARHCRCFQRSPAGLLPAVPQTPNSNVSKGRCWIGRSCPLLPHHPVALPACLPSHSLHIRVVNRLSKDPK